MDKPTATNDERLHALALRMIGDWEGGMDKLMGFLRLAARIPSETSLTEDGVAIHNPQTGIGSATSANATLRSVSSAAAFRPEFEVMASGEVVFNKDATEVKSIAGTPSSASEKHDPVNTYDAFTNWLREAFPGCRDRYLFQDMLAAFTAGVTRSANKLTKGCRGCGYAICCCPPDSASADR